MGIKEVAVDDVLHWLENHDCIEAKAALELIKLLQAEADLIDDFYIETLETINIKHMRVKQ